MDPSYVIKLILLILLLFLSSVFSSMETCMISLNQMRVRSLADEGNAKASVLLKILSHKNKMLSAVLIGNNIVNLSASSLVTSLTIDLFKGNNYYVGIATGILTLLILIFGEITPKTMATQKAMDMALGYARILWAFMTVMTPVVFIINILSNIVLKILHVDPNAKTETITESELRTILDVSHEEGIIEQEEKVMINNVVDFGDSLAKDIMIPRIDMISIDVNSTYEELIELFRGCMFTRIPVYEETNDNVIGILNMKDILFYDHDSDFSIRNYMRQPHYTFEHKNTSELFMEMRRECVNIAIVLDEYGATAGLITMEDLLEEIVGEIRDEYDEDEKNNIVKLNEHEYIVEGSMKLSDINDVLHLSLESDDYDSIGGLIIGQLDKLPDVGDTAEYDGIKLIVDELDRNRIQHVRIILPDDKTDEETQDKNDDNN